MKKYIIFILLFLNILIISSCGNKINVIINYDNETINKTIKINEELLLEEREIDNKIFIGLLLKTKNGETRYLKTPGDDKLYSQSFTLKEDTEINYLYLDYGTRFVINYELEGGTWNNTPTEVYDVGQEMNLPIPYSPNGYTFIGWNDGNYTFKSLPKNYYGECYLKAIWVDENIYHKITVSTPHELDIKEIIVPEGKNEILPIPKLDNNYFDGWYLDPEFSQRIYEIPSDNKNDFNIYPKFHDIINNYPYISFLGDSITTFAGYIPEDAPTYYPLGDVEKVEDTWWYQVAKGLHYNLLVNNSYSGSKLTNGTSYAASIERIKALSKDNQDPDVIIIHIGTNDFTGGISTKSFKIAYLNLIKQLRYYYDDVEIYICNFGYNAYGDSFIKIRESYNEIIKEISIETNVHLVDFTTVLKKTTYGSLILYGSHPNKTGMSAMANYIIEKIEYKEI